MTTPQQPQDIDRLIAALEEAKNAPEESAWQIYHFLKENYKTVGSSLTRQLLSTYMKLPVNRPSLVHSCILAIALKVAEQYNDFRLPSFLGYWGYDHNLRQEDRERQTGKDGRKYLSLQEKTERAIQSYMLRMADEYSGEHPIENILPMIAVKIFQTEHNGRRIKSVKLVSADGIEHIANSHLFPCKPWEISGRMFNVLLRQGANGSYVHEIALSSKTVADIFPVITGYVEGYDATHNHYHIYDAQSRHFVSEAPTVKPQVGSFVTFSPIIPREGTFKSAIIHKALPHDEGCQSFGTYSATVTYINKEKDYFFYKITSAIAPTPEGVITPEGSARLSLSPTPLAVGMSINILLFLKRGKDKKKHNYVCLVQLS